MAKRATHGVRLRHRVEEFNATLDRHPVGLKVIAKDGFGLGLRDEEDEREASIGYAEVAKTYLGGAAVVEMNEKASAGVAAADQHLPQSQTLEDFQAAGLYTKRPRFMDAVQRAVDDPELHAEARARPRA
jgi:hypothetical protein